VAFAFQSARLFLNLTAQADPNVLTLPEPLRLKFRAQLTAVLSSASAGCKIKQRSYTLWNVGSAQSASMFTTPPLVTRIVELPREHHSKRFLRTGAARSAAPEKMFLKKSNETGAGIKTRPIFQLIFYQLPL